MVLHIAGTVIFALLSLKNAWKGLYIKAEELKEKWNSDAWQHAIRLPRFEC